MERKIKFKDLDWWLKIAIIYAYISLILAVLGIIGYILTGGKI